MWICRSLTLAWFPSQGQRRAVKISTRDTLSSCLLHTNHFPTNNSTISGFDHLNLQADADNVKRMVCQVACSAVHWGTGRNLKLLEACEARQHRLTQIQMQGSASEIEEDGSLIIKHGWFQATCLSGQCSWITWVLCQRCFCSFQGPFSPPGLTNFEVRFGLLGTREARVRLGWVVGWSGNLLLLPNQPTWGS